MGNNLDKRLIQRSVKLAGEVHRRKSMEEKLRKTDDILEALFQASPAGITLLDRNGSVQFWNHAAERIFGWTAKEVLGRPLPTIPPGKHEEHRIFCERVLRGESFAGIEVQRQRKDGSLVGISLSTAPLHDAKGNVTGIVGVMTDITDRKRAEEERRRSQEDYRELVEKMNNGFIMQDEDGIVVYVNKKMCEMLGYTHEEIIDHRMTDFYDDAGKNVYRHQMLMRKGGEQGSYNNMWIRKDGGKLSTIVSAEPKFDEAGHFKGSFSVVTNITELKELEGRLRQTQKMESLGALAGGIAHDFSNILGIILGYTLRLEEGNDGQATLHSTVEGIKKAVERGSGLVGQILTFARKTDLSLESIDVNAVIDQLLKMLKVTFPKSISFSLQLERDIPFIMGDPSQLYQALVNIGINARDAIMPDAGTVSIRTETVAGENLRQKFHDVQEERYVGITVADTGKGIDEAIKNHIFEPFITTKGAGNGTGLGLSVVYGTVKSHRGFIECESEVGKGTTFRLYFPVLSDGDGTTSPGHAA